jgi:hypothetical protein
MIRKDKKLVVQRTGHHMMSISFANFFERDLKDAIKALPEARYDSILQEWQVPWRFYFQTLEELAPKCA